MRINANRTDVHLKHGSTKGRGPGEYFSIVAEPPEGKLVKFLSEANYEKLKKAKRSHPRSRSRSRSMSSSRSRSRSSSHSRSGSPASRSSRRRRSSSGKKMRKVLRSKCNKLKSGKKRSRKSCLRDRECAWVSRSKRRRSYCKRV